MAEVIKGLYRPRNPTTNDFYRLVEDHADNLAMIYPEKYEKLFGFYRPVVTTTMNRYLECGIYENGFARVRCGDCKDDNLTRTVKLDGCFLAARRGEARMAEINFLCRFPEKHEVAFAIPALKNVL